jgi:hypothetical protein
MTDKAFREWIRRQPSCISGRFSEWVNGEGRCVAAHVRRAKNSGTGFKASFCCVPLTQEEHLLQHQKGEAACLARFHPSIGELPARTAAMWFDEQVKKYESKWRKLRGEKS